MVSVLVLLLAQATVFGCRRDPFPDRHVVQIGNGETLQVLQMEMEAGSCTLWYMSEISLTEPEAVKQRAHEIVVSYAGPQADRESCTTMALNPTEWRKNGSWRALELTAKRGDDGVWDVP